MNVEKLIEKLKHTDPRAEVVVPGSDHSYHRIANADETIASLENGDLYEYHGEEHQPEGASKRPIFVIE